jgi:iron complex outermembrane receptor protein
MFRKSALLCAAALIALPTVASGADQIETVVVTARKRVENIQHVPVAVTAVSSEQIHDRTLSNLSDVQEVAPNVFFTDNTGVKGTSRVFIRGIGENTLIYTADPAVGIYVDGIPLSRPQGSNVGLLDVDHIEVLRGPQGTTFGKNTIGGAINFVSKRPSDALDATFDIRAGNYNFLSVAAAADTPVNDKLSLRFSGQVNIRQGFIDDTFNNSTLNSLNNWTLRGMAEWKPTPNWDFLLSADYFDRDENSNVPQLLSYNPASALVFLWDSAAFSRYGIHPFALALDGDPFKGFYSGGFAVEPGQPEIVAWNPVVTSLQGKPNRTQQKIWGTYLISQYTLSEQLTLRSLTSYRKTLTNGWFDSFGTAIPLSGNMLEEDAAEVSQEFQVLGQGLMEDRLNFVAGLYLGEADTLEQGTQWFEPELMSTVFNLSTSRNEKQQTRSIAPFGNANFKITDRLEMTLGARWTQDTKNFHRHEFATYPTGTNIGFGPAVTPQRPTAGGVPVIFDFDKSWAAWSGTAALQYQWTDDLMTYVSWSRGFRSGGFSGTGRSAFAVAPYKPEFADTYEVGLRSSWLDHRIVFNATGYWTDYTNRQLGALRIDTSTVPFTSQFVIYNAGSSRQTGVELELDAHPTDFWDITGAYGLIDAKYTKLAAALNPGDTIAQDLAKKLPETPHTTLNIGTTFHFPVANIPGEFSVHGDWVYRSKVYFDIVNSTNIAQDGFGLFNARVAWSLPECNFEFAFWARNLADRRYKTDGTNVAGNFAAAYFGDPRTLGVELTKKFD